MSGFNKLSRGAVRKSLHLYVANCGPAVGFPLSTIEKVFASFGPVAGIRAADDSGTRVIISFHKVEDAAAAKEAWSGRPCHLLQGRIMYIQFSVPQPSPVVEQQQPVAILSSELGIPGLELYPDFVSTNEEQELLAAVDSLPWQTLAKRRVQHYGYEFLYKSRNVDLSQKLGNLPSFLDQVVERISFLPGLMEAMEVSLPLDQLTVNEYPKGVGLSPHIDTHSAFERSIISLSLAGACVMEFRRYVGVSDSVGQGHGNKDAEGYCASSVPNAPPNQTVPVSKMGMERRALFLPQRSLLVLSDEARYAWHHYIPHHKVDKVGGQIRPRESRRVSFTFRKVRSGPCQCKFVKDCDSQASMVAGSSCLPNAEKIQSSKQSEDKSGESSSDCLSGAETEIVTEAANCRDDYHKLQQAGMWQAGQKANLSLNSAHSRSGSDSSKLFEEEMTRTEEVNGKGNSNYEVPLSTPQIEKLYVHRVYNAIAPHFSATRFAKWPKVALFLDSLPPGSLVADCGCGNGKYLGFNPNCFFIGCDISPPLVAICAQKGHEALVADALHLPHRTGFYDAAISIAVLHHLSNDQRRRRAIEELVRVVRSGGKILITVWAREQEDEALVKKWIPLSDKYVDEWVSDQDCKNGPRQEFLSSLRRIPEGEGFTDPNLDKEHCVSSTSLNPPPNMGDKEGRRRDGGRMGNSTEKQQEYFVPWHLPYHRAEVNGASAGAIASGFARKDDKKGAVVYDRYYHVFAKGELERLATGIHGAVIVDQFYDKSNWCIILQKS